MLLPDGQLPASQPVSEASVSKGDQPGGEGDAQKPAQEGQFEAPKTLTDPQEIALAEQIREAAASRQDVLAFVVYDMAVDRVEYSKDGNSPSCGFRSWIRIPGWWCRVNPDWSLPGNKKTPPNRGT